ncbi:MULTISPECIES: outer membrane beta-barrel protein [unclassified Novosphingobium]|uniref:outer membrane beta-barrel protein n=1 Tax=unclassified Novosphingobium TaxID=2644732 RepID=UPI00145AA64A|nr:MULTISPECIES: outer membrane beta-barrel protein [unclassified Novosphingobium]MBB3360031.1 hypothetical protein [Novosphingobium sp. BK256]MBB3376390.1 hypothetical protein [Novosphingobium sp. BK280]MBB3380729.1 hypothetical protein [Novosphingobium sp. BK258]MBB3422455.1 hypothetical protein [Novosphingobium sp. BK267]MBB3451080.1 hypothetical protein [Novosphingobium sp. BK352]
MPEGAHQSGGVVRLLEIDRCDAGWPARRTLRCAYVPWQSVLPKSYFALSLAAIIVCPTVGHAQSVTTLVDPFVPVDFDRGRNKSVVEDVDPHFLPVGVRAGGVELFPAISFASGATDNVYVNNVGKVSDALFTLKPQLRAYSDWSRHNFSLNAGMDIVRYLHQSLRNRQEYTIASVGDLDISKELKLRAKLNLDRQAETPYLSELTVNASVLSQYTRFNPALSVVYEASQARLTGAVEHYSFRFNNVTFTDGSVRSQAERDRNIERVALQGDYAFTPSIAVYLQVNADHTHYLALRSDGSANRDGNTYRLIGGLSLDLSGLLRGKVGLGYTRRLYDAARYGNVGGLTFESNLQLFVSPLTTVTLGARSAFQDINYNVTTGAYRDVTWSAGVDHALLRNLLLSANALLIQRSPVEKSDRLGQSIAQVRFQGAYQADRYTTLTIGLGFGRGRPTNNSGSVSFNEFSGQAAIQLRL